MSAMSTRRERSARPGVIMFHSVADRFDPLPWKAIVCSTRTFATYLSRLHSSGFQSVPLIDYLGFLQGKTTIPDRSVVITFDDGYLDNWVNGLPLLEQYGFTATVFVATDFIDPRDIRRSTLLDYREGRVAENELDWYGYLSWPELREMHRRGTFDIGSHTKTHTWYFSSPRIVDFHRPGDPYVWLEWNRKPDRKPFWMKDGRDGRWGAPVYAYEPALTTRIYREDADLEHALIDYVREHGGETFFDREGWRTELFAVVDRVRAGQNAQVEMESEESYERRVREELVESRRILEEGLGKKIEIVSWPNDSYNCDLAGIACNEAGYKLICAVETCDREELDCPCVSRHFVGDKYDSAMLNIVWFSLKMAMIRDTAIGGFLRRAAKLRRQVRNGIRREAVPLS